MPNHRKSNTMHRLHGTYRADRHGGGPQWPVDDTLDPTVIPEMYDFVARDAIAAAFWQRVAPVLHSYGLLTQLDLTAFAVMAHLYGDWVRLTQQIDAEGVVVSVQRAGRTILKPNIKVAMANKVGKMWMHMAEQFGMSPKSRRSLGVEIHRDGTGDELDKYLDKSRYFN